MKVMMDRFFLFLAFLLGTLYSIAGKGKEPPHPNPGGKNNSELTTLSTPPPPPGMPIDENIVILIIIALLFGIYIIYNHRLKTKASI